MKNRVFMKKALLAAVLGAALSAFMGCDAVSEDLETYTVTYDANNGGGTVPTTQTADDGSSVTVAGQGNLTYIGKTFNGWNTNSSGTGTPYTAGASLTVTRDVTLYAQWLTIYYTLTYNANGGSGSMPSVRTVDYGSSVTVRGQEDLTYSGKTFNGWNTNSSGTGTPYSPDSHIAVFENVTLYAQWLTNAPAQYTVTFDADGGSPTTQTKTVNSGGTLGASMPSNPTRSGYSFGGWYTAQNGGGSPFTGSTSVYGSMTVYATWTANAPTQYTVTFDADGGSPGTQTKTVNSGGMLGASLMPSNPIRSGYTFGGWYTARYGSGSQFTGYTSVNSSITVYAQWTADAPTQYTVTYNANGGSGTAPSTQAVNAGSSVIVEGRGSLTYSGKTFTGWNTNSAGTGTPYSAGSYITVSGNVTLYAQWETTYYTVTYNANGGSGNVPPTETVNTGSSVAVEGQGSLTYSGKTFTGWNTNSAGTGTPYSVGSYITVSGNVTLYAQWQEITVTLTAPRIDTSKSKNMTSDGMGFIIYLTTSSNYIDSQTQSYKLYRSTSQYSGYSSIATIPASASTLVFEDKNISFVEGIVYHYKVAAVYGSSETMSTNAMMVTIAPPSITMRRSTTTTSYGYCRINLVNAQIDMDWYGTTSSSKTSLIVEGVSEGTYTLYTKTSSSANYVNRGTVTFGVLNKYTIYVVQGTVNESLDTSNWSFFTP
jgi:uncharacterized repeat protein (TIGR02543 family)